VHGITGKTFAWLRKGPWGTLMAAPTPIIDGLVHPQFFAVVERLREQLRGAVGGAAVCVYHRGECVADLWGGYRDATGTPWTKTTMAPSFSTTKGVASTLVHIMADRGLIDYDERVAKYWPEFGQAGKQGITVRQVLAHQSGLYHIRQMIDRADRMLDWNYMIRAIERAAPIHEPGTRTGYHGLTYGFLVGEILQRVTGKSFSQLVQEEIAQPLGLDGMYIGAPREVLHRAAKLVWRRGWLSPATWLDSESSPIGWALSKAAPALQAFLRLGGLQFDLESILDALAPRGISSFDFGAEKTLRAAIPAANGLFTARSLAKLYAALADGGAIDGVRLLSRKTLAQATRLQTRTGQRLVIPWDLRWRLGYHGVATTQGVPARAFGHFGFGGSGAWADPERRLAVALIVNSGYGTPFGDMRILRIGGSVLACAERRGFPARRVSVSRWRRHERAAPSWRHRLGLSA
jgi:CubicO group peptidase (beta-lactamase class C family)